MTNHLTRKLSLNKDQKQALQKAGNAIWDGNGKLRLKYQEVLDSLIMELPKREINKDALLEKLRAAEASGAEFHETLLKEISSFHITLNTDQKTALAGHLQRLNKKLHGRG